MRLAVRSHAIMDSRSPPEGASFTNKWRRQLLDGVTGGNANPIGRKQAAGRKAYTDKIEEAHPGHLHELHRLTLLASKSPRSLSPRLFLLFLSH